MRYLISYDLNKPGKNYDARINAITAMGGTRVLLSQWVVRRNDTSASGLRDHFWTFMDANDRLLVVSIDNSDWAGTNLMVKISSL